MSGELSGDTGVVTLAAAVSVSVFPVRHGTAVLLQSTGGGHIGGTDRGGDTVI